MNAFCYEIAIDITTQNRQKAMAQELYFQEQPALVMEILRQEEEKCARLHYVCRGGTQCMAFHDALELLYRTAQAAQWPSEETAVRCVLIFSEPEVDLSLSGELIRLWQSMGVEPDITLRFDETGRGKAELPGN